VVLMPQIQLLQVLEKLRRKIQSQILVLKR
jgi:hypothetical protein